jgi:hypothetical protein
MSIYYFQGAAIAAPISFESESLTFSNKTLSLAEDRIAFPYQRFAFTFATQSGSPLTLFTHLTESLSISFLFNVPQLDGATKVIGDWTTTTASDASVGSNTLSIVGEVPVGRFIRFATHKKLYLATGQTGTTLTVFPALVAPVVSGTDLLFGDNVQATVLYDSAQVQSISFDNGVLSSPGSIKLVEDVS